MTAVVLFYVVGLALIFTVGALLDRPEKDAFATFKRLHPEHEPTKDDR